MDDEEICRNLIAREARGEIPTGTHKRECPIFDTHPKVIVHNK